MSTSTVYPFDPTGTAATNKIVGELQSVTAPPSNTDYFFIVPNAAPFFRDSVVIKTHPSGTVLHEGVDFVFTHQFHEASLQTGLGVYGSITFYDRSIAGTLSISYQTIGGDWTLDDQAITELLINKQLNPRITTWEQVVQLPFEFPPINHEFDIVDFTGAKDIVDALTSIRNVLAASDAGGGGDASAHILDTNNPHMTTKAQVGLGSVQNFPVATLAEAQVGSSNLVYMTALRTKQAIDIFAANLVAAHEERGDNPHNTTKVQVGLGNVENYPFASQVEAEAGLTTDRYMSPLRTAQAIASLVGAAFDQHRTDIENPHGTTKVHVGLSEVENNPTADQIEAETGLANDRFMTPLRTAQAINAMVGTALVGHLGDANNPHGTTASQVGAYTATEVDQLLQNYLGKTEAAIDSQKAFGQTKLELIDEIVAGGVDNASKLEGLTLDEVIELTLQGKAADSAALEGLTKNQLFDHIAATAGAQQSFVPAIKSVFDVNGTSTVLPATTWTKLATVRDLVTTVGQIADIGFILVGGAEQTTDGTPVSHATLSFDENAWNSTGELEVSSSSIKQLNNVEPGYTLHYRLDFDGTSSVLEIWAKNVALRDAIMISDLSKGCLNFVQVPMVTSINDTIQVEPGGSNIFTNRGYVLDDLQVQSAILSSIALLDDL